MRRNPMVVTVTRMSNLVQITDSSFESEVLKAGRPVIVGFWAPWSVTAAVISSTMRELSERYASDVKCVYVNVDEDPRTPATYGIKTLPTLLLFEDGEVSRRISGAAPRERLEKLFVAATEQP